MGKVVIILIVIGLFLSLVLVAANAEQEVEVKVFLPVVPIQKWHVIREYPCEECPPILKPMPLPTYTPEAP